MEQDSEAAYRQLVLRVARNEPVHDLVAIKVMRAAKQSTNRLLVDVKRIHAEQVKAAGQAGKRVV